MVKKTIILAILVLSVLDVELYPQGLSPMGPGGVISEMCKRNGAEDKISDIETAGLNYIECLTNTFDIMKFNQEFQDAMYNNVFHAATFTKYCTKVPQLKTCFNTYVESFYPCTDMSARNYLTKSLNTNNQVFDYICYNNGERITNFIDGGGPRCIERIDKVEVKACVSNYTASITSIAETQSFSTNAVCSAFNEFQDCLSPRLEQCHIPETYFMLSSILAIARDNFSCVKQRHNTSLLK